MPFDHVYYWHKGAPQHRRLSLDQATTVLHESIPVDAYLSIQRFNGHNGNTHEIHICPIFFDLDSEDLEESIRDAKKLAKLFCEQGISLDDQRWNFSGRKGFHCVLNPGLLGCDPSPDLTARVKVAAIELARDAGIKTLCLRVYTLHRLLRVPGSIHGISKAHACPIPTERILDDLETSWLWEQATTGQTKVYARWRYDWEPCEASLQAWFQGLREPSEPEAAPSIVVPTEGLPACMRDLLDGSLKGRGLRNSTTFQMGLYLRAAGWSEQDARDLLVPWASKIPPELRNDQDDPEANTISAVRSAYQGEKYFACGAMHTQTRGARGQVACDGPECQYVKPEERPDQEPEADEEKETPPPPHVSLLESVHAAHYHQEVTFVGTVVMKDKAPMLIQEDIQVGCVPQTGKRKPCQTCIWNHGNGGSKKVSNSPQYALDILSTRNAQIHHELYKKVTETPEDCKWSGFQVTSQTNILALAIQPEYSPSSFSKEDAYRENDIYVFSHDIDLQKSYEFKGKLVRDPKTNIAVHVCNGAKKMKSDLDGFDLTPDQIEQLRVFQPREGQRPIQKLEEIHNEYERHVHGIRGRTLQSISLALTWHSPIGFVFLGEEEARGWLDVLLIGDSDQGKTKLVDSFIDLYGLGDKVSSENMSRAGILAGVDRHNGRNVARIGRLPRNDGGLIIFDEWHEAPEEVVTGMTEARSSGQVKMDKIAAAVVPARVRKIFVANPVRNRNVRFRIGEVVRMEDKPYGIQFVPNVMYTDADVRRCDMAIGFKVSDDITAKMNVLPDLKDDVPVIYTRELSALLARWMFSRAIPQTIFDDDASRLCYEMARQMSAKYTYAIPLVGTGDTRLKIARVAASIAGATFSHDESARCCIVKTEHVLDATQLIDRLYSSPDLQFDTYSERMHSRRVMTEAELENAAGEIGQHQGWHDGLMLVQLEDDKSFTTEDLVGYSRYFDKDQAEAFFNCLGYHRMIRKAANVSRGFELTRRGVAAITRIFEWEKNGKIISVIEGYKPPPDSPKGNILREFREDVWDEKDLDW